MAQDLIFKLGFSGFSLIFVLVGLYTMYRGRQYRARSGRIAATETTSIRDLQPGTVEVKGTAHPAGDATPVASPITKADALAARVEVEEWETSGQGGGSWETIHETETAVPITVDDGTGEVGVELPPDGRLNLDPIRTRVDAGEEPPGAIRRYVESDPDLDAATRHDIGPLSVGDRRRYSEGVIEPGEEVYVLGRAREERAGWGERAYVIDEPTEAGDFVLSDKSEADLITEDSRIGIVLLAFGGIFALVGALFALVPWVGM